MGLKIHEQSMENSFFNREGPCHPLLSKGEYFGAGNRPSLNNPDCIGLAMDAFAVSLAKGMATNRGRLKSAILVVSFFGAFQTLIPAVGWYVGQSLSNIIAGIDHWMAFGLLFVDWWKNG